jgi:hypothetical protein
MAKTSYGEKLKDPRWQRKRLGILERDGWSCRICSDSETTLHVHHIEYGGDPWDVPDNLLVTLCEHCHCMVEKFGSSDFLFSRTGIKGRFDNDQIVIASINNDGLIIIHLPELTGILISGNKLDYLMQQWQLVKEMAPTESE